MPCDIAMISCDIAVISCDIAVVSCHIAVISCDTMMSSHIKEMKEKIGLQSHLVWLQFTHLLPLGFSQCATGDEGDIVHEQLLWSGARCTDCIPVQCHTGEEPRAVQVSPGRQMIVGWVGRV